MKNALIAGVVLLILVSIAFGGGWWYGTRGAPKMDDLEEANRRVEVVRDSMHRVLGDSAAVLIDIANDIRVQRDTVDVIRFVDRRNEAGADLQEYLADDPTGLGLLSTYDAAWDSLLNVEHRLTNLAIAESDTLRRALVFKDQIIASDSVAFDSLTVNFDAAIEEANRWYQKAHPPLAIKLLNASWKIAGGVAIGYLIGKS